MNKEKQNEAIAKILGFEKIPPTPERGVNYTQWSYPKEWEQYQLCSPVTHIPDFVKMLEQVKDIERTFNYGLPLQKY